jgi:transcriptional regulator with XRE-family HTH domain
MNTTYKYYCQMTVLLMTVLLIVCGLIPSVPLRFIDKRGEAVKDVKALVGKHIRTLRKEKGLSQEELGDLADLHHTYIGAVERGERNCSIDSLSKIAKGLNVNVVDLFVTATRDKPQDINKIKAAIMKDIEKCSPATLVLISDLLSGFRKLGILLDKNRKEH